MAEVRKIPKNIMTKDKRKHHRIDSLNLSYISVDENDNIIKQGMGRTLNISESGILLETNFLIDSHHVLFLSVGLEDELVDIKGKVVYCRAGEDKKFETGIEFLEIDDASLQILKKFIKVFRNQKKLTD